MIEWLADWLALGLVLAQHQPGHAQPHSPHVMPSAAAQQHSAKQNGDDELSAAIFLTHSRRHEHSFWNSVKGPVGLNSVRLFVLLDNLKIYCFSYLFVRATHKPSGFIE